MLENASCHTHVEARRSPSSQATPSVPSARRFQGKYPEARVELEKAVAAHPEEGNALVTLARLEAHSSRDVEGLRKAEDLYRRGLKLTPENGR